jgi:hypothetical protein
MYEHVITLLTRDETESLFCIEKLHDTLCHEYSILRATDRPIQSPRYMRLYSPGLVVSSICPDNRPGDHYSSENQPNEAQRDQRELRIECRVVSPWIGPDIQ